MDLFHNINYSILGYTACFGNQVYLINTDENGVLLWSKGYGGPGTEGGYSLEQTYDSGFIISALTNSFDESSSSVYLVKTDSIGNSLCYETNPPTVCNTVETAVSIPPTVVFSNATFGSTVMTSSRGATVNTLCISVGITSVNFPRPKTSIFPNPFSAQTVLQSEIPFQNATLLVYNSLGEIVRKRKNIYGQSITLNRDNLTRGLYHIQLIQDNKIFTSETLIIID